MPEVYTDCVLAKKSTKKISRMNNGLLHSFGHSATEESLGLPGENYGVQKKPKKTRIYTMGFCIPRDAKNANHSFFILHTESVLVPNLLGEGLQTFLVRRPLEPKCFSFAHGILFNSKPFSGRFANLPGTSSVGTKVFSLCTPGELRARIFARGTNCEHVFSPGTLQTHFLKKN